MNHHPVKATLLLILLTALGLGLWQGRELSQLKSREASLRAKAGSVPTSGVTSQLPGATKSARRDARAPIDAVALVQMLESWAVLQQNGSPPSDKDAASMREAILSASPRELKMLVEELRRSGLPEELKKGMSLAIAPRLADSDPKLATELAVEGGEGNSFRMIMRSWLRRDPKSAAAWLEEAAAGDPPLDKSRFKRLEDLDLEALSCAARLAADPKEGALDDLFSRKGKALGSAFGDIAAALPPAELAALLNRISKDPHLPETGELDLIGYTLARHEDPALARQVLLDAALSPERFTKAATTLILDSDPIGIRAGVEWFRNSAPAEAKAAGLRDIVLAWALKDRKSAIGWVEGLPDSAERAELLGIASGSGDPPASR